MSCDERQVSCTYTGKHRAPGCPVVEVYGSFYDGIPACVCEAEMARVPPFVLVVRVFVGGISELTDSGVEVHFFTGNHDIWCGDYLTQECGIILHREPLTTEIYGKEFYLAHGDGLGDPDRKFKCLRAIFHSHTLQTLFSTLHPRWSVELGLTWAKHNRLKRINGKEPDYMGEDKEPLVLYTKDYLKSHPNINFFIYGHRHIELDLMLNATSRVVILGDWINCFSYAVFDSEHLFLENYIEGETRP